MADPDRPQIVLITPPVIDLGSFPDQLAVLLDSTEVACVRLAAAGNDVDAIGRAADVLRAIAHDRDVALVIERHQVLVGRHGLDGVHLTDAARSVRAARKALGADAIVGCYCANTRHDGISAAEAGADYVSYGPVGALQIGDGTRAERDLFDWWFAMIEVPVVAEGGLDEALVADLAPVVDFFAFGEEVWSAPDPAARLRALAAACG